MKRPLALFALLMGMFITPACAQSGNGAYDKMLHTLYAHTVPLIGPEGTDTLQNLIWLDAREYEEYEVSHLPGARWVGYETFNYKTLNDLPKDTTIVVYCSVGYRSEKIGERLEQMGFKTVYNLYGGIFQWKNEDRPVVDQANQETQKVHAYSKTWGIWLKKGEKVY